MHFLAEIKIETKSACWSCSRPLRGTQFLNCWMRGSWLKVIPLYEEFETIDKAKNVVKLKTFQKFVLPLRHLELPQLWLRERCPRL